MESDLKADLDDGAAPKEVLLAGFPANAAADLTARLDGDLQVVPADGAEEAARRFAPGTTAVLCVGPGLDPGAALELLRRVVVDDPRRAVPSLLLAAGDRLERFQELVDDDRLFYICGGPPTAEDVARLVISAAAQARQRAPVETDATARVLALTTRLAEESSLAAIVQEVAWEVETLADAVRGECLIYDRTSETLWTPPTEDRDERRESAAAGLVSFAARTGYAVAVERVGADPRYDPEADNENGPADQRLLAVPSTSVNGAVEAVLVALRDGEAVPFGDREQRHLALLGEQLAPIFARLRRRQELEHDKERQQDAGRDDALGGLYGEVFRSEAVQHYTRGQASEEGPVVETPPSTKRRRIRLVQQMAEADCGAACLTMVLAHHGKDLRLESVRDTLGTGRDGTDASTLLRGAQFFGLGGRAVKVDDLDKLRYLEPGSILHWDFHHYVVFEGLAKGGRAWIVDPATGRRRVTRDELARSFTGIALIFWRGEDFEPGGERRRSGARFVREVFSRASLVSRILGMSLLLRLLALATPVLTGVLVDRVVPQGDHRLLTILAAGLAAIVVFDFLSAWIRDRLMLQLRTHLDTKITLEFLEHLVSLPYSFFQQRSTGDLMMRLNSNTTIREILTSNALTGLLDGALVFLYMILLFFTHAGLAVLVLLLGLLRIALFVVTRRRHRELMGETLRTRTRSRTYQVQMLSGIETLKAIGAESQAVEQWAGLFAEEINVSLARGRLDAIFNSLLQGLSTASPFIVLVAGTAAVLAGDLSLGTMLAVSALAVGFWMPLSSLVTTAVQLQLMNTYLERIDEVLETPPEQDPRQVTPAPQVSGRIAVEHLGFRYSPMRPRVVRDVSLEVTAGSFVAIVGPSGAGKSTLAYLLMGLYRPTEGRVLYDDLDLWSLDVASIRRQLGIVLQQPYLFGDTIRNNIALGDAGLPLERLVEAAKLAHIHDHVASMPMGYDTPLVDGGLSLSGGQRQRLALARALVRRPAILLLDEATSHLDAVSERQVHEELVRMRATRIVIAHRLSTVVEADQILVMGDGQIVERGTHDELIAGDGFYRELFEAQLREKREHEEPRRGSSVQPGAQAPG